MSLVLVWSHFSEIYVISCLLHNLLNFHVRGIKFCGNIKWKMSSQEQSFVVGLFYWRNRQWHFFIILNFKWFFSKSPLCLCLKISTTNTPLLGKKEIWCHDIIWWYQHFFYLVCFCHFWDYFFSLPCNFISFNAKEMELCSCINSK